jgi:hypothetical protein
MSQNRSPGLFFFTFGTPQLCGKLGIAEGGEWHNPQNAKDRGSSAAFGIVDMRAEH